jgi:hypothetical protein
MSDANGIDCGTKIEELRRDVDSLEARVDGVEAWRELEVTERQTLLRIAQSTADKVDELILDTRAIRTMASDAKAMAAAALPQMRAKLASASSEIEAQLRDARGEIKRLARDAARSDNPEAIEASITKYFEARELAMYRSWKKGVAELAKKLAEKLMWPLLALAGAGVLHAIRLAWLAWTHH